MKIDSSLMFEPAKVKTMAPQLEDAGFDGAYTFDLRGDSIDVTRYMEPADAEAAATSDDAVPVEIPVDLIRTLNAEPVVFEATESTSDAIEDVSYVFRYEVVLTRSPEEDVRVTAVPTDPDPPMASGALSRSAWSRVACGIRG